MVFVLVGWLATLQVTGHRSQVTSCMSQAADSVREYVVLDYGLRTVRTAADNSISRPEWMKRRERCFIVASKKDYYLYVYEAQGADTVMLARYDMAYGLKTGDKMWRGDMRTPHSTMEKPFYISQIQTASSWRHDFGDGRGNILAYGDYFMRLKMNNMSYGIGIHGSTNNAESVPGRASEGCIRLRNEDLRDLNRHYAFVGMKVVIKSELSDDFPFETRAFRRQHIARKRHFAIGRTLTDSQVAVARVEQGRHRSQVTGHNLGHGSQVTGHNLGDGSQVTGQLSTITCQAQPTFSETKKTRVYYSPNVAKMFQLTEANAWRKATPRLRLGEEQD